MIPALAYALRRTSARVVLAFALGGLVWVVYRAVHREAERHCVDGFGLPCSYVPPMSSHRDVAAAALGVVVALLVAVVLWRGRSISR